MTDIIESAFTGRVGQPPTVRTSKAGKPWCTFSVAVGADDDTQWVNVSAFGETAEAIATLQKGARVYVEGRLKLNAWTTHDGTERTGLQVAATLVQPLGQIGKRRPAGSAPRSSAGSTVKADFARPDRMMRDPSKFDALGRGDAIPF